MKRATVWIAQGNHALLHRRDGLEYEAAQASFPMVHLPIRSREQLLLKLRQGSQAYRKLGVTREKVDGSHWFQLQKALQGCRVDDQVLNAVIADYGSLDPDITPLPTSQLAARGFRLETVDIAQCPLPGGARLENRMGDRLLDASIRLDLDETTSAGEEAAPVATLETFPDGTIRRSEADAGRRYGLLCSDADPSGVKEELSEIEILSDFLRPSYWYIDDLVPSAWAGHIPFLFSLVALEQPRRYVELGTHFGASFLAFCQAAQRLKLACEPIAIDTWQGDDHAGHYDESVFDRFKFLLRKYQGFASFLRMRFDEAAPRFAAGSIDLLLIDGLHTDEAVIEDFETWLPKMSERGIILFHDTNVHERDFGVWRLWRRIERQYPSFEFRHSHGLGIAYVGSQTDRPVCDLIRLAGKDFASAALLQQHFERISEIGCELFINKFERKRNDAQGQSLGEMTAELVELKQRLAAAETERDQTRALLADHARKTSR